MVGDCRSPGAIQGKWHDRAGSGDYGFLLTAVDGQTTGGGGTDKFRIKIWDKTSGQIIYDTEIAASDSDTPTSVLGGGSIAIQK